MAKHFVSSADVSVRMFRSDVLERFSRVHPAVPHLIYAPIVGALLWLERATPGRTALLWLGGLGLWTLAEYLLHRFVFHAPDHVMAETHDVVAGLAPGEAALPALPTWRHKAYFIAHGVHHEYPSDSTRLVMPPGASVPAAVATWLLFGALFGAAAPAVFAGFVTGYLVYDTTHFAVHHFRMPTAWGRYLKKRHARHHFLDPDSDYGVSSPLWDVVFRTFTPARDGAATRETA
jgi:4-hydroxysphinganine ceramide fatty acyl 2-hydroxylase